MISSSTSSSTRTVSSAVSMVTPFSCAAADLAGAGMHILTADVHGVDDVGDVALTDGFENFVGAVVYLRPDAGPDTMLAQENRGANGCLDVEASR